MKKSQVNLSYTHLTTFDMGELVPVGLQEVVQGDVFEMSSSALVRFSPLTAPVMHKCEIVFHHWFVPHRVVWPDFDDFITSGPAGVSAPVFPTITLPNSGTGGVEVGSLANYLGVPLGYNYDNTGYTVSALPFRVYASVYNYRYRDEDLQTLLALSTASGPDVTTSTALKHVNWEKDYFTTARPYPQKGPEVTLPLGNAAPVYGTGAALGLTDGVTNYGLAADSGTSQLKAYTGNYGQPVGNPPSGTQPSNDSLGVVTSGNSGMEADLTDATAASVTDVRMAFAAQTMAENNSRYGNRITEYYRRMGIKSSDARFQEPEYLGGGVEPVQFSEVLATSDDSQNGVGSLYGHGIGTGRSNRFIRFFNEPGYILSLVYVRPKTIYLQGIPRHWNRRTRYDFFQPEMQFIGQMSVPYKEVYAPHTTPEGTFGYQDRNDDLRRSESRISGEFAESELDNYHFARQFDSSPALNASFVECVPSDIPFADQGADTIRVMVRHNIRAKRLISRSGKPKIV